MLNYHIMLDYASSTRSKDEWGRLHISRAKITAPVVNDYGINELSPAHRAVLSDAGINKPILKLYRDKEALAASAQRYANQPLYLTHTNKLQGIDHDKLIGTVGSDIVVDADGAVWADLCIWDEEAVGAVETNEINELSGGYGYDIDPTPGSIDNNKYDAKILVNAPHHLALVKRGRAGPTVKIGDSEMDKLEAIVAVKLDKSDVTATNKQSLVDYRNSLSALLGDSDALPVSVVKDDDDYDTMDDAAFGALSAKFEAAKKKRGDKDKKVVGDEALADAMKKLEAKLIARHDAALATRGVIGDMALSSADEYYRKALTELKVDHAGVNETLSLKSLFSLANTQTVKASADTVVGDAANAAKPFSIDLDHIRRA